MADTLAASRAGTVLRQFLLFGAVGVAGFVVDSAVLLAVVATGLVGLYVGRVISYLCAATFTWALNRVVTFRATAGRASPSQWARFVGCNTLGACVNLGVYAWCLAMLPHLPGQPVTAVAAGSLSGLLINFTLSRVLVFPEPAPVVSASRQ
jgi:putative flippase GtrA